MKSIVYYFLLFIILNTSCSNLSLLSYRQFKHLDLPVILKYSDAKKYDGQMVYLIGIYKQVEIRKKHHKERKRKFRRKPQYHGLAGIEMKDRDFAFLEPNFIETAIRSQEEIKKFEGKLVQVKGRVVVDFIIPINDNNPSGVGIMASVGLSKIEGIEFVKKKER